MEEKKTEQGVSALFRQINDNGKREGLITVDDFIKAITIDFSIKNEADLIKRYQDEAKKVNLLGEFDKGVQGASIRVEFPSGGKNRSEEKRYVNLSGGVLTNKILDYGKILGENRLAALGTNTKADNNNIENATKSQETRGATTSAGNNTVFKKLGNTDENVANRLTSALVNFSFGVNACLFACDKNYDYGKKDGGNPFLTYFIAFSSNDKDSNDKEKTLFGSDYVIKTEITQKVQEISSQIRNKHIQNLMALHQREAIQSAIAALMARNMSHNLGSHPITNTKNYFRNRIEEVASSKTKPTRISLGADYRGNVHFLQYIKERMDFIATVVSGDPYPFGALNFKAQLFDVLTEDDHGKRHDKITQNFLLKYLVFSEKLTRSGEDKPKDYNNVSLRVLCDGEKIYTGEAEKETVEKDVKRVLSNLELAVPGGLMGRHAFFCIIENIIRNSAKHSKKNDDLVVTIKLKPNKDKTKMDISIFNNRKDGESVMKTVEQHFKDLVIVKEENGSVDKNCKGLKEMLICALWLRNENVACKLHEIQKGEETEKNLYDIQNERKSLTKIDLIKKYLEVSLVDDKGEKIEQEDEEKAKTANLCYTIKDIPLFEYCHYLKRGEDYKMGKNKILLNVNKIVDIHADIVVADENYEIEDGRFLSDIFPRFVDLSQFDKDQKKEWNNAYKSKNGEKLFELFDKNSPAKLLDTSPTITIDSSKYIKENIEGEKISVRDGKIDDADWTILFRNHFNEYLFSIKDNQQDYIKKWKDKYLESESGENFTSTITTYDFLQDFVNRYKVVEAANTRIAIIDERIYGDLQTRRNGDVGLEQKLLELRGIYLLNFDKKNGNKIIDLQGKEFNKNKNINFVSIHLGLLDKKDKKVNLKEDILDKYFDEKTFVSIHSGRGNFSADLESELKNYPFISLSALEAAFYDCKYFLTQLFKTTNYYGKGNITDK